MRARSIPTGRPGHAPEISVVIPTHQRRESLRRVLEGLDRQSHPSDSFSVVVVCDGCTDGTQEMLRGGKFRFALQVIDQQPAQGPAAARNRGLALVEAPVVIFLDDDVIPGPQFIATHMRWHTSDSRVAVIGPLLAPSKRQQPWIRWEAETLRAQYDDMISGAWAPTPRQFYTGNASVEARHLRSAGGFDERFMRGEDVELAFRLQAQGVHFVFDPAASGMHIARRPFRSWVRAAAEYGRVEQAMGSVWGDHGLVDVKIVEFRRRHPAVRGVVSFGLRIPWCAPAMIRLGGTAGGALAAIGWWRLARGAYTAVYELAYWRGVAEAAGVGLLTRRWAHGAPTGKSMPAAPAHPHP